MLGEFVLPHGGTAWTSAIIDVMARLGVEEKAARQALMRTADDGWLTSQRHGQRTLWTLSSSGERLLTEGTERIYGFTGTQEDWDDQWLLVLARIPESDRAARQLLRTRLPWAGLGNPEPAPGILAAAGAAYRLPDLIGRSAAKAVLLLAGHILDADTAFRLGLVMNVTAPGELIDRAHAVLDKICGQSPLALRLTKLVTDMGEPRPVASDLAQAILFEAEDKESMMAAFLERRRH